MEKCAVREFIIWYSWKMMEVNKNNILVLKHRLFVDNYWRQWSHWFWSLVCSYPFGLKLQISMHQRRSMNCLLENRLYWYELFDKVEWILCRKKSNMIFNSKMRCLPWINGIFRRQTSRATNTKKNEKSIWIRMETYQHFHWFQLLRMLLTVFQYLWSMLM